MLAREVVKREGKAGLARKRPTMSAAARKRISEAQKARWAKQKAEATGEVPKTRSAKKGKKSG